MNIRGKLVKILEQETGTTKTGSEWKKQTIVIDTGNEYNPELAISFFGEKINQLSRITVGTTYDISINLSSREYNGKYYHNIDGWWCAEQKTKEIPQMEGTKDALESLSINDDLPF